MAIALRAFTVVVRNAALERRFSGGVETYAQQAPNGTYMSDGTICAVSFMVLDDARRWATKLVASGLTDPFLTGSDDIAVFTRAERLTPCAWLECGLRELDIEGQLLVIPLAWVADEAPVTFSPPSGWRPHRDDEMVSERDLRQNYEVAGVDHSSGSGVVTAYRHRITGRTLYVGRPALASHDQRDAYARLEKELQRLLGMPSVSKSRENALVSVLDEAGTLARASTDQAIEPLWVHGVAARLLRRWALAAQSLRRVTELNPSFLNAWLELTWALAMLNRLEEAEASARRAVDIDGRSAPAHGNLASVLLQRGRPQEALPVITRALELEPSDTKNRLILQQVRQALHPVEVPAVEVPADPEPWYKRWFRSAG